MFYCQECQEASKWPISISKSFGKCEICGKRAECNDMPSKYIPLYKGEEEE